MRITHKLMLGFFFVSLFVIVSGVVGIIYTGLINSKLSVVTKITSPTDDAVDDMIFSLWKSNQIVQQISIESDQSRVDDLRSNFDNLNQKFKESEGKIRTLIAEKNLIANLDTAVQKQEEFANSFERLLSIHRKELQAEDREEKENFARLENALLKQMDEKISAAVLVLDEISIRTANINTAADEESYKALQTTRVVLTITTLLSLIFAVLIARFLSKSIINPINDLSGAAEKISAGNFNAELKLPARTDSDEIVHLASTFNQMTNSLRDMLEESPRLRKYLKITPLKEKAATPPTPKYDIESGFSYIIKEQNSKNAFEIFTDKTSKDFKGLCITRTNPPILKEKYGLENVSIIWLSDVKDKQFHTSSDLTELLKIIDSFTAKNPKSIILIDRIDYLIAKHSFQSVLNFIIRANDKITVTKSIMLCPVDPRLISIKHLPFLEKEFRELEIPAQQAIPEELLRILRFIDNKRALGQPVTFKDIGREFSITAPTTQKKIHDLYKRGLIRIVKQGRNKLLEPTEDALALT